ncbi:MAG: DUF2254 domain-containing protein [Noviherbaspirillum sp.]
MRAQLLKYWERVRSSFWFLPSLMAAAAVVLAFLTVEFDRSVAHEWLLELDWVYSGGAEGASAVLQTIAGSMITIAGVVFSLTLVALSLASSQFGPRLLRNFMRDTTNQLVLGTFIATFLYCLLVLRTIRRAEEVVFVPHLSVTLGVVFALASLWVLIYFIHHVSVSIQADEVVARVGVELDETMTRLFPEQMGEGCDAPAQAPPGPDHAEACIIRAEGDGYLQIVDLKALMEAAQETDTVLRLARRPGHYIVHGSPLLSAFPAQGIDADVRAKLQGAFVVGTQRTASQDVEFAVLQLVEIGTRALSPGVNDPFTAIACIDRLGSGLCRLAQRRFPDPCRYDSDGKLRIVASAVTFAGIVDAAFNQLRQYARTSVEVTLRLLETIEVVAAFVTWPDDRAVLEKHADMIARGAAEALPEAHDRQAVAARYHSAKRLLGSAARDGLQRA